ncbi:MAG: DUF3256 family protein [Tannerellaceae bacterium]|nr:DUF3256 family protein [Tannerellaceae bacterium]MCD8264430.1 DUF3256 family protein [Tannerellaceae bacterium]
MKHWILIIFLSITISAAWAQDMASFFIAMPDRQLPFLESTWRKDLVELYNTGKEARLQNTMEGYSTLKQLTGDYLLLQTSERSTLEMKLLPLVNNSQIICVVSTVEGPVADSQVSFYTTTWQPLPVNELFRPEPVSWFLREEADTGSDRYKDAVSRLDMELVKYTLSPDDITLTAMYTTPLYLSREDRELVKPYVKEEPKVYRWERSQFR